MNIHVSNLSFDATDKDLNELFSGFGEVVSAKIITDREPGRSRGFGFVEMSSDEAAAAAISALDKSEYAGRTLNVNEARPREARPQNGGFNRGGFNRGGNRGYNREGGNRGYGRSGYNRGGFNRYNNNDNEE